MYHERMPKIRPIPKPHWDGQTCTATKHIHTGRGKRAQQQSISIKGRSAWFDLRPLGDRAKITHLLSIEYSLYRRKYWPNAQLEDKDNIYIYIYIYIYNLESMFHL